MAKKELITHRRLLEVLEYNSDTGVFVWKITRAKARCGQAAGSVNRVHGYVEIGLDGALYRAHRLAFFYMTGSWPKNEVDHIDLNRSNNKWENLRSADHSQNARNKSVRSDSATGLKGAYKRDYGSFASKIKAEGKVICLGTFRTAEEAHAAYCAAAEKYHGEFVRTS